MNDIKLYILEPPSDVPLLPQWADSLDRISLDIDSEFKVQLNKNVIQLSDFNELQVEATLGGSLPGTGKNDAMLDNDVNYHMVDNAPVTDHPIHADLGYFMLRQNTLRILSRSEITGRYEEDIIDSQDHWFIKLQTLFLNDLPFGKIEFNEADFILNQATKAKYITNDEGYYFPLVHYGNQVIPGEYSLGDFRPWVHSAKVYELLSNLINHSINFPFLQTEVGARKICYLLKDTLDEDSTQLEDMKFRAELSEWVVLPPERNDTYVVLEQLIILDNEIFDNGDNYDPTTGKFTRPGYHEIRGEITIYLKLEPDDFLDAKPTQVAINLVHQYADGTRIWIVLWAQDSADLTITRTFTYSENILVSPGDSVHLVWTVRGDDVISAVLMSASMENVPISITYNTGDIINLQKSLRHDPIIEMIKGDIHLLNLRIYYDENLKTIHFLTPYDVDYYGDIISGYYKDITDDITSLQLYRQEIITTPAKYEKNTIYKFKESTDPYVKKKEEDAGGKPYHATFCRFIDRGFDKDGEDSNDIRENPYWEPTLNGELTLPLVFNAEPGSGTIDIPFCVDNLDGKISYKIGPRTMIAYGNTEQLRLGTWNDSVTLFPAIVRIFGLLPFTIPYAFQFPNAYTSFTGDYPDYVLVKPEWKMVYGNYSDDHYEMFYRRWERDFENRHKVELKLLASLNFYFGTDFRNRVLANGFLGNVMGRLLSINNYDVFKETCDVEFIPDAQVSDGCITYVTPDKCANYPTLLYTKDGALFTFYMGGSNSSTISEVIFQYKLKSSTGDFIDLPIPAELTSPNEDFIVRMIVKYANPPEGLQCADQVRTRHFDPCGNSPAICTQVVEDCLIITECGTHNSAIANTLIEYSTNGLQYNYYNGCINLLDLGAGVAQINIRITVTYTGGCPSKAVEDIFTVNKRKATDCPDVDSLITPPGVIGVTTATGFELVRTGSYNCCAAIDKIKYRKKGSNADWKTWVDGASPTQQPEPLLLNQDYEAQRVIIWCGKDCDPWCSPVVNVLRNCAGSVNYSDVITSCDHQLMWEHPDTPASDTWKVEVLDDQIFHVPSLKTFIRRTCGAVVTDIDTKTIIYDRWNFRTQHQYTWAPDYKIESIEVHRNVAGVVGSTITIPVNVIYTTGANNDNLAAAIRTAVETYLSNNYSAVNSVHYDFEVEIIGSGTNRTLKLIWWAKHVVSATWIGVQAPGDLLYVRDPSDVQSTVASTKLETQKVATSDPISSTESPCGNILKASFDAGANKFLDDTLSNFDTMVANASVTIVETIITDDADSCNKHVLTAVFTCGGAASYIWKDGQTVISTTNTVTISGTGKVIWLYASCGTCTYKKSITLT